MAIMAETEVIELELTQIIMKRDRIDFNDFCDLIVEALEDFSNGKDPATVLSEHFGVEPDYIFDLLEWARFYGALT